MALAQATAVPQIALTEFDMERSIGRGASGDVYKCHWKTENKYVALKQVTNTKEYEKEVEAICRFKHPNIIQLFATTSQKDMFSTRFFLVLELAHNGSLYDYFRQWPKQPDLVKSIQWAIEVANAMTYLHEEGQTHRDLKSQNVLLTSDWRLSTKKMKATAAATACVGTHGWMAPEVLHGKPYSNKCDVYSFGMLLWELITHEVPYSGLSETQIQLEVAKEIGIRPEIPESCVPELEQLIEDCWQDDSKKRPEFKEILDCLLVVKVVESVEQTSPVSKPVAGFVSIDISDLKFDDDPFGGVFKGQWLSKNKVVAIRQTIGFDHLGAELLFSSLSHPNFIKLFGVAHRQPNIFIVAEYAEHGDLSQYMKRRRGQPELEKSIKWAKEVAEGMCYLHEKDIAHRDLRSRKVLLNADWTAKINMGNTERRMDHTTHATMAGTFSWMAPEVMRNEPYGKKCDVYSYAIVLWELASFQAPFKGVGDIVILMNVAKGERPPIPSDCDQFFSDLMKRCWVDNYKERPSFDAILKEWRQ